MTEVGRGVFWKFNKGDSTITQEGSRQACGGAFEETVGVTQIRKFKTYSR